MSLNGLQLAGQRHFEHVKVLSPLTQFFVEARATTLPRLHPRISCNRPLPRFRSDQMDVIHVALVQKARRSSLPARNTFCRCSVLRPYMLLQSVQRSDPALMVVTSQSFSFAVKIAYEDVGARGGSRAKLDTIRVLHHNNSLARCNRHWCEECYKEPVSRIHPTQLQQLEMIEDLQQRGWASVDNGSARNGHPVKVHAKLCVEYCLYGEEMRGSGSNGMWG